MKTQTPDIESLHNAHTLAVTIYEMMAEQPRWREVSDLRRTRRRLALRLDRSVSAQEVRAAFGLFEQSGLGKLNDSDISPKFRWVNGIRPVELVKQIVSRVIAPSLIC